MQTQGLGTTAHQQHVPQLEFIQVESVQAETSARPQLLSLGER